MLQSCPIKRCPSGYMPMEDLTSACGYQCWTAAKLNCPYPACEPRICGGTSGAHLHAILHEQQHRSLARHTIGTGSYAKRQGRLFAIFWDRLAACVCCSPPETE